MHGRHVHIKDLTYRVDQSSNISCDFLQFLSNEEEENLYSNEDVAYDISMDVHEQASNIDDMQVMYHHDKNVTHTDMSLDMDKMVANGKNPDFVFTFYNVPRAANLTLRYREDGDRFEPSWRNGSSVKVKDFLRAQNVPLHLRDEIPLVVLKKENETGSLNANDLSHNTHISEIIGIYPDYVAHKYKHPQKRSIEEFSSHNENGKLFTVKISFRKK